MTIAARMKNAIQPHWVLVCSCEVSSEDEAAAPTTAFPGVIALPLVVELVDLGVVSTSSCVRLGHNLRPEQSRDESARQAGTSGRKGNHLGDRGVSPIW